MLMLIVGKKLEENGMKAMLLVVTNKESKCTDCRIYLILMEKVEHGDLFTSCCESQLTLISGLQTILRKIKRMEFFWRLSLVWVLLRYTIFTQHLQQM